MRSTVPAQDPAVCWKPVQERNGDRGEKQFCPCFRTRYPNLLNRKELIRCPSAADRFMFNISPTTPAEEEVNVVKTTTRQQAGVAQDHRR